MSESVDDYLWWDPNQRWKTINYLRGRLIDFQVQKKLPPLPYDVRLTSVRVIKVVARATRQPLALLISTCFFFFARFTKKEVSYFRFFLFLIMPQKSYFLLLVIVERRGKKKLDKAKTAVRLWIPWNKILS